MNIKYRIREHQGEFYVEVFKRTESTKGMLWWKKTDVKEFWVACASDGRPPLVFHSLSIRDYPMPPFKTLKEAKQQIKLFLTTDKIHEYAE